jgi:putative SOS response-associated peptidase YedK
VWHDKEDESKRIVSCTILTTDSVQGVKDIHDRMPVILPKKARARWLDREADPKTLEKLLHPFTEAPLEIYEVSSAVNSPGNQGEELVARVTHHDGPLLAPD